MWEGRVRAGWLKLMMLSDDSAPLPSLQPPKLPVSNYLACSEAGEREEESKSIHLQSQVEFGWGSSALMQEDVALTEAACPLSKSNYDNHASGKGCSQKNSETGFDPAGCLFKSLLTSSAGAILAECRGAFKKRESRTSTGSSVTICRCFAPPWNIICFSCPSSHQRWVKVLLF